MESTSVYQCWGLREDTPTPKEMLFKDMGVAAAAESDETVLSKALGSKALVFQVESLGATHYRRVVAIHGVSDACTVVQLNKLFWDTVQELEHTCNLQVLVVPSRLAS